MTHFSAGAADTPRGFGAAPAQAVPGQAPGAPMRQLYLALADGASADHPAVDAAAAWLDKQLAEAGAADASMLPSSGADFAAWHQARHADIDDQYKQYMAERRAGQPRRLFSGRAHALYYLGAVAPARLTDGAWLYGVLARWDDPALRPLITTYLEELGNGVPDKNHVVIYQQLIDSHGCGGWQRFGEPHFHSGLTQLALGHHAQRYLPELVGYNLGVEHAALDTLIAAYELNELGIDPYYFSLHATVDNHTSGHARLALDALAALTPPADAAKAFLRRVDAGFRLHGRAPRTADLLRGFELRRELQLALAGKHIAPTLGDGAVNPAHALQIGERALGEWLARTEDVPALLETLERDGWIVRGADPAASRFWQLIEAQNEEADGDGPAPPLAGLFSDYELALLADWIADRDAAAPATRRGPVPAYAHDQANKPRRVEETAERGIIRHRFPDDEHGWEAIANELSLLEAQVVASSSKEEAIALLTALMAPSRHHSSAGLMATRMFSKLFTA